MNDGPPAFDTGPFEGRRAASAPPVMIVQLPLLSAGVQGKRQSLGGCRKKRVDFFMSSRKSPIDRERQRALNAGTVESRVLAECLSVDFAELMRHVVPAVGTAGLDAMAGQQGSGILSRMHFAAEMLLQTLGASGIAELGQHPSDTVRGWACFMIGAQHGRSLQQRLAAVRPLADDRHFGVREWAWLAIRPHFAADLDAAIALLVPWAGDPSERIRRFASESIRPRGVWCTHLAALKQDPGRALPVIEPLRGDPARYVQDSVANWLNDAAKSQPDWVRACCARWQSERPEDVNTQRIIRRGCRSLV